MSSRPLLLGHRGARAVKSIPENTLASFDRALADGCDGFEFDVRLTSDGEAVVCHDPQTGGIKIAATPARSLPALPRLQEVLQRYQQSAFLDIELKVSGLEKTVVALLSHYPPSRGFVVSSFLPEVLRSIHAANPTIPLGLICDTRAKLGCWRDLPVEYVIPHYKLLTWNLLDEVQAAGRKVIVWTVNETEGMKRFAEWGVAGIVSDETERLVRVFRPPNSK